MTHHTNAYTPAHGWAALQDMLSEIAERFGTFIAAPSLTRTWRDAVLHWLRPAEHLARLLLFVIARALPPLVKRVRARRTARPATRAVGVKGFAFTLPAPHTGPRTRLWRARPRKYCPRPARDWRDDFFRDRETEARERAARRAAFALRPPPPERPPAPPRENNFATAPLVARIAALARVLADPDAAARRIGARARDEAHTARLLAPWRILTRTTCGRALLHVHDLAHTQVLPPDSS